MRKLIVITGASSGIGAATARRLAADGAQVVLLARRADRLEALAAEIGGVGHPVDLSDGDATAEVCRRILGAQGVPDVVINNAGSGRFLSIEETSEDEMRMMLELPLMAAFRVTRGFIEPMMERGSGVIFQINTPVAVVPWPGAVGYATARYGLRGFTESLRQDLRGTGVHVGQLMPTRVHSDYFKANPGAGERIPKAEAVVGSMTPAQVASAVARCLDKRPGKDSYAPWRWAATARIMCVVPGPFAWLYSATGYRRPGRAGRR